MNMYENKKVYVKAINEEVHVSRILASWANTRGRVRSWSFLMWLDKIGVTREDQDYIREFACNGKMELEHLAIDYDGTKK